MLSQVNDVFSRHGINVAAQYLQTTAHIGYVVIDVDPAGGTSTRVLKGELDAIDGTIRTRLLY
jgi:D-3-phosphoglycerate dehydrogenase